ncbi:hypothetical protein ACHAXS_010174 [Conticribra weissflogii]
MAMLLLLLLLLKMLGVDSGLVVVVIVTLCFAVVVGDDTSCQLQLGLSRNEKSSVYCTTVPHPPSLVVPYLLFFSVEEEEASL